MAQSIEAVEYTDCISAEGQDPRLNNSIKKCPMAQSTEAVEYTNYISAEG